MEELKKIETGDSAEVEATDTAEETPEVEVKKEKPVKVTKKKVGKKKVAKKEKPVKKEKAEKEEKPEKVMPEKAKAPEKANTDAGKAWWKTQGSQMTRRGHSQRNIMLKAARDAGKPFGQAMKAMRMKGSVQKKAESLFD